MVAMGIRQNTLIQIKKRRFWPIRLSMASREICDRRPDGAILWGVELHANSGNHPCRVVRGRGSAQILDYWTESTIFALFRGRNRRLLLIRVYGWSDSIDKGHFDSIGLEKAVIGARKRFL